jgi:hypothetical protein
MTKDIEFDLYSGVVELETIRITFLLAANADLKVVAGDISSAYVQALTIEKMCTRLGEEFGHLAGVLVIIIRALYGLKLSGAMWWQRLSDVLRGMGFTPCKADHDLWMRKCTDHYEYIGVIVDDLLVFSKNPELILEPIQKVAGFELKGVGAPEYYSGADMFLNPETGLWEMSAKTYVKNVCDKIEKLFGKELKAYGSPMEPEDHPELDDSELLSVEDIPKYQMLIGCAQWAVTLGRCDIQYVKKFRPDRVPRD